MTSFDERNFDVESDLPDGATLPELRAARARRKPRWSGYGARRARRWSTAGPVTCSPTDAGTSDVTQPHLHI